MPLDLQPRRSLHILRGDAQVLETERRTVLSPEDAKKLIDTGKRHLCTWHCCRH